MKNYIAIDLGGTNLRVARVNSELVIEEVIKFSSEIDKGIEQIIDKIVDSINALKDSNTCSVGLSVPGQVDIDTGVIVVTTNIPFKNEPIAAIIKERCGLDSILNNDANVAGLGESIKGAGKNSELVYYITWSTGIGGALIINKKIINGKNMYTGEIGNIVIRSEDSYKHSIMVPGALEGLTSGTALKRYATELGYDSVSDFISGYTNGDVKAVSKIEYVADNFARAIATIYHVIEVDLFVIGGGVTLKSGDVLLPLVKERLNQYVMDVVNDKIKLEVAQLGDDAGLYGAAALAMNI